MFSEYHLTLNVSHSQLAIFDPSLERPFNFWTDRHVAQGFAWRPGSASFGTTDEGGLHHLHVLLTNSYLDISPVAIRAIEVPFRVPLEENIEIASVGDSRRLQMPSWLYALRYESLPGRQLRCAFMKIDNPKFRIVRADAALHPTPDLLLTAEPA
jgi:Competence protein J (ComJ)